MVLVKVLHLQLLRLIANYISAGLLFSVYLCFCSAFHGAQFYHKRHPIPKNVGEYLTRFSISSFRGYSYFELVYAGGILIAIITALTQIIDVYKIVLKKKESLLKPIIGKSIVSFIF